MNLNFLDISIIFISINIMEKLDSILFYSLEKAIKSYRQFAQRNMMKHGFDLTIDQWLVLKAIIDNPSWTQQEIAEAAFKDFASVTRIVELLVKKQYLIRAIHSNDRRRFSLTPTDKAIANLQAMQPITESNRKIALQGISHADAAQLQQYLIKIIENCKS
jgi:DNA-binding MarR family transcriptional regulator